MIDDCSQPALSECARPISASASSSDRSEDLRATVRRLEQELIACQRLAVLGSMTAMVTHEFNNLLTPIMARVEAALTSADDAAYTRQALERTLVHTQRALAVTRHLLDLAHDHARPMESCVLASAVREAIETMTRPLDKDGIELRLSVPEDLRIRAQSDLLCQALLNLLLNARRAMNGMSGVLSITAVAKGRHVQIDVRDSGKGIPRELLDRAINPFLAADPADRPSDWQAVGLGLSVCRLIARHHGATLQGLANEERGCTFRLLWPLATPDDSRTSGLC